MDAVLSGLYCNYASEIPRQGTKNDPGWGIYNHNYRLKAAASGNQNWAELDPHLYSQCFTGRAKKCNSFRHAQEDCPHGSLLAIQGQQIPEPPAPAESSVSGQRPFKYRSGGKVRNDICFAFDQDSSCPYKVCRFKHMCSKCGSHHPASQCRRSVKGREERCMLSCVSHTMTYI